MIGIKYLIEDKKVDINSKDNRGYTPLHQASKEGNLDLVKYLVETKAGIKIAANNKNTPFMEICRRDEKFEPINYMFRAESHLTSNELKPLVDNKNKLFYSQVLKGFCKDIYQDFCLSFKPKTAFTFVASLKIFQKTNLVWKIPKPIIKMIMDLIYSKSEVAKEFFNKFSQKFVIEKNQEENLTKFFFEHMGSNPVVNEKFQVEDEDIAQLGKFLSGETSNLDA